MKILSSAVAVLPDAKGEITFHERKEGGCTVRFALRGFDPRTTYAVHIHEYGDTRRGCASLGGHYNPLRRPHGHPFTMQRHLGDLMNNLTTDGHGSFNFEFSDSDLPLHDLYGRSVVLHELPDDMGLGRVYETGVPYASLTDAELQKFVADRGYSGLGTRRARLDRVEAESKITGNAGRRKTCALIGRCG